VQINRVMKADATEQIMRGLRASRTIVMINPEGTLPLAPDALFNTVAIAIDGQIELTGHCPPRVARSMSSRSSRTALPVRSRARPFPLAEGALVVQ
jgi:hypothetical protein